MCIMFICRVTSAALTNVGELNKTDGTYTVKDKPGEAHFHPYTDIEIFKLTSWKYSMQFKK